MYHIPFLLVARPCAQREHNLFFFFQKVGMDGMKRKDFYIRRMKGELYRITTSSSMALSSRIQALSIIFPPIPTMPWQGMRMSPSCMHTILKKKEPICAGAFPCNSIDATIYPAFIEHNNITKGIIVTEKRLPPSKIARQLKMHPNLHFLTPLKRNDSRIAANDMFSWQGVLCGIDRRVAYCSKKIKGGRWLYAFKDMCKTHREENLFFDKLLKGFLPNSQWMITTRR